MLRRGIVDPCGLIEGAATRNEAESTILERSSHTRPIGGGHTAFQPGRSIIHLPTRADLSYHETVSEGFEMDATLEDALTTWFDAEQQVRAAPWNGMVGEQRKVEHARTMLRLQRSADSLFDAATQLSLCYEVLPKKKAKRLQSA